jgi:hypothetical protein
LFDHEPVAEIIPVYGHMCELNWRTAAGQVNTQAEPSTISWMGQAIHALLHYHIFTYARIDLIL